MSVPVAVCSLDMGSFPSLGRPPLLPQLPVWAPTPISKLCSWRERGENYIRLLYFKIALLRLLIYVYPAGDYGPSFRLY